MRGAVGPLVCAHPNCAVEIDRRATHCRRHFIVRKRASRPSPFELIRSLVEVDPVTGCWLWKGRWHGRYGQLSYMGKRYLAHRFVYTVYKGPIPAGYVVMHRCDVGACVRPDHLEAGTQRDNVTDMISKGRAGWQAEDIEALVALGGIRYSRSWGA